MLTVNIEAETYLQSHLTDGEEFIWAGCPKQGIVLNWYDIPFTLLSIVWLVLIINRSGQINFNENPASILLVVLFCGIGLYFALGRFLWDMYVRKKAFYGLTNKRVIISSITLSAQIESISIKSLTKITKTERLDSSGSIILMNEDIPTLFGTTARGQYVPTLKSIENVKEVYDKILELQKGYMAH